MNLLKDQSTRFFELNPQITAEFLKSFHLDLHMVLTVTPQEWKLKSTAARFCLSFFLCLVLFSFCCLYGCNDLKG